VRPDPGDERHVLDAQPVRAEARRMHRIVEVDRRWLGRQQRQQPGPQPLGVLADERAAREAPVDPPREVPGPSNAARAGIAGRDERRVQQRRLLETGDEVLLRRVLVEL
jgi:hypothetical protein